MIEAPHYTPSGAKRDASFALPADYFDGTVNEPVLHQAVKVFLNSQGRGDAWREILADENAEYDVYEEINLSELEPLVALPSSPGNVVPVREVAGP